MRVVIRGDRETGLVGILAAGQCDAIDAVETTGLLASYGSPDGYGRRTLTVAKTTTARSRRGPWPVRQHGPVYPSYPAARRRAAVGRPGSSPATDDQKALVVQAAG